jgi:hypothetical protein
VPHVSMKLKRFLSLSSFREYRRGYRLGTSLSWVSISSG